MDAPEISAFDRAAKREFDRLSEQLGPDVSPEINLEESFHKVCKKMAKSISDALQLLQARPTKRDDTDVWQDRAIVVLRGLNDVMWDTRANNPQMRHDNAVSLRCLYEMGVRCFEDETVRPILDQSNPGITMMLGL